MDSINKNMLSSKQNNSNEMGNELEYDIFVLSEGSQFDHVDWCDSNIKPFIKEDITNKLDTICYAGNIKLVIYFNYRENLF